MTQVRAEDLEYILLKSPSFMQVVYSCGGKIPCDCFAVRSVFQAGSPALITLYRLDEEQMEQIEEAERRGLIVWRGTDMDEAASQMEAYMERAGSTVQ